jgi:hypothetical protein
LIPFIAENNLSTDALVVGIVTIKLTSSARASFRPLVMRYSISLKTGWFQNSLEEYITVIFLVIEIQNTS